MRPRFMNRGSGEFLLVRSERLEASMRPRFMNRGSEVWHVHTFAIEVASMRPRFMNRGSRRKTGQAIAIRS